MNYPKTRCQGFQRNQGYAAQGGYLRLFSTKTSPLCGSIRNMLQAYFEGRSPDVLIENVINITSKHI